mmetsp:Transcript_25529/g.76054  ORF Transcript_25529/g.76054 Transcript_25529/m.76054 type:complete len:490 (+) Transcript_25529:2696-4165(+)
MPVGPGNARARSATVNADGEGNAKESYAHASRTFDFDVPIMPPHVDRHICDAAVASGVSRRVALHQVHIRGWARQADAQLAHAGVNVAPTPLQRWADAGGDQCLDVRYVQVKVILRGLVDIVRAGAARRRGSKQRPALSLGRERRRVGHNRREKAVRAVREVGKSPSARAHRDQADEDGAEHVAPAELGPGEPAEAGDGAGRGLLDRRGLIDRRARGLLARLRALLLCLLLVLVLVDLRHDVRLDVVEQTVLVGDFRGRDLALALRLLARVRGDPVGPRRGGLLLWKLLGRDVPAVVARWGGLRKLLDRRQRLAAGRRRRGGHERRGRAGASQCAKRRRRPLVHTLRLGGRRRRERGRGRAFWGRAFWGRAFCGRDRTRDGGGWLLGGGRAGIGDAVLEGWESPRRDSRRRHSRHGRQDRRRHRLRQRPLRRNRRQRRARRTTAHGRRRRHCRRSRRRRRCDQPHRCGRHPAACGRHPTAAGGRRRKSE